MSHRTARCTGSLGAAQGNEPFPGDPTGQSPFPPSPTFMFSDYAEGQDVKPCKGPEHSTATQSQKRTENIMFSKSKGEL